MRCRHVQEGDFVGPLGVVARGQLHRISGILETLEVHAFDDATVFDVQTGNNTDGNAHE